MTSISSRPHGVDHIGSTNRKDIMLQSSSTEPLKRIKCTYAKCKFYFQSEKEMIKHKKADSSHFYCHKCDVDCDDDTNYMIHQILSPKHIVCPSCGLEFKSSSGRDRHVEISHAASQRIPCRGCQMCFPKASGLMRHIENDECRVIRLKDFQQERAERSIMRDAFQDMLDPFAGSSAIKTPTTASVYSDGTEDSNGNGGVSLLENNGPHLERDWQGRPIDRFTPILPGQNGPYRAPQPQFDGSTITALSKFPALPATKKADPPNTLPKKLTSDLMDINEAAEKISIMSMNNDSAWARSQSHAHLFPRKENVKPNNSSTLDTDSKYDQLSEISFRTYGSQSRVPTMLEFATRAAQQEPLRPIPAANPDLSPHAHITTLPPPRISKLELDKHWDTIRECYVCPGVKCRQTSKSRKDFNGHLLSPAHVGGHVCCPSCLRIFKTNAALISHMESGAKNCNVRNSTNYNQVLREVSAGLIGTSGHLEDGTVKYMMPSDEGWAENDGGTVRSW